MIFSHFRQRLNLAVLLVVIGLHMASIAAAHYMLSHPDGKSAAMRPLTVELAADTQPMPKSEAPSKLPSNELRATHKTKVAMKPLAPAVKTDPTPSTAVSMQEVQHDLKTVSTAPAVEPAVASSLSAAAATTAKTSVTIPANYAASNRKPNYPKLSRDFDEQGTVVLRVLVQSDGSAGEVQIRKSSGHELLDESARTAVRNWRFNPATSDGKAIAEWYQISIPFTLQN